MDILVGGAAVGARSYEEEFPSDAPAPIFVHGAGIDHSAWAPLRDELATAGRPFIAVDLPGRGGTGGDLPGGRCRSHAAAGDPRPYAEGAAGILDEVK